MARLRPTSKIRFPPALIERVDVLTGGASAVYGADAVAGVVNFIMNDRASRACGSTPSTVSTSTTTTTPTSATSCVDAGVHRRPTAATHATAIARTSRSSRASIPKTGAATPLCTSAIATLQPITQNQRDFSACALALRRRLQLRRLRHHGAGAVPDLQPVGNPNDLTPTGTFTLNSDGTVREFQDSDLYNFAPSNYYQRPDERRTAGLFAHYDFSDKATVYTEFMFMDDRTDAQIAPSGAFLGSGLGQPPFFGRYAVNCYNPLLSPSAVTTFCGGNTRRGRRPARHRPAQRRRRRPPRRSATHLLPRRPRPARRHRRRLELRRVWPVRYVDPLGALPERHLAHAAQQCAARRDGPERSAGVPHQRRRQPDERRSDLRALCDLRRRQRHPGSAQLSAGARPHRRRDGRAGPERLDFRRPRPVRPQAADRERRSRDRVRRGVPLGAFPSCAPTKPSRPAISPARALRRSTPTGSST